MKRALPLLVLGLGYALPIAILVVQAGAPGWRFPEIFPELGLDNPRFLAERPEPWMRALLTSTVYSLATVGLTLAMCIVPARTLAFRSFKGKSTLEALLLLPALVPAMSFAMGLHHAFILLGLTDNVGGVVLVLAITAYPYMLRALTTGCVLMGEEYAICARNLGAPRWMIFRKVEGPILLPAMAAGASVVFLVAFSEYFLVYLIGGGTVSSFSGYLFPLITSSNRGLGALTTLIFLAVPIALFILLDTTMAAYHRKRAMR